jgi:hypothetical protein
MNRRRTAPLILAAALLAGCATSYDLTLMPRTSGTLYKGDAFRPAGSNEATVNVAIGSKTYTGTWVVAESERSTATVSAGVGFGGRRGGFGVATGPVWVDGNGGTSEAKALLRASDGSGLRCDLRGITGGRGTGVCIDDAGMNYDVQIRVR